MNTPVQPKNLKAVPLNLPEHRDVFYGGEWHKPKSGHYAEAINPGTGESLGPFADGGAADVDAAVGAAKRAFEGWRNTPPFERARLLKRVANVLRENAEELAMIDAADCGNPVHEMVMDATVAANQIDFYAGLVTEMKGASIPMGRASSISRCASRAAWSAASSRSIIRSCSAPARSARRSRPATPW